MADDRLRQLERRARSGDAQALLEWRADLARMGRPPRLSYTGVTWPDGKIHLVTAMEGAFGHPRCACSAFWDKLGGPREMDFELEQPTCKSCLSSLSWRYVCGAVFDREQMTRVSQWLANSVGQDVTGQGRPKRSRRRNARAYRDVARRVWEREQAQMTLPWRA